MKRVKNFIILSLLVLLYSGCSKDTETYTKHPVPNWFIESPESLPNSFTAIVSIPNEINIYATDDDKIAAFIGGECRGVGNLVVSATDNKRVYYITVRGNDTETHDIIFKYYNAKLSYMYQATQTVVFVTDGTYGTNDSPVVLNLEYI